MPVFVDQPEGTTRMTATISPIAPADGSFVAMCVDPETAAEYGTWPFVSERDIVATPEQWQTLDAVVSAANGRCTNANGHDDGSWTFRIIDDAGRPGRYDRRFDHRGTVRIDRGGALMSADGPMFDPVVCDRVVVA